MKKLIKWLAILLVACVVLGIFGSLANKGTGTATPTPAQSAALADTSPPAAVATKANTPTAAPTHPPAPSATVAPAVKNEATVAFEKWLYGSVCDPAAKNPIPWCAKITRSSVQLGTLEVYVRDMNSQAAYFTAAETTDLQDMLWRLHIFGVINQNLQYKVTLVAIWNEAGTEMLAYEGGAGIKPKENPAYSNP